MPFFNFGLEGYVGYGLYAAAVLAFLLSVFRRPVIGLYFLVPLLPLQTIRYRLNSLPLGESVVYIILIGVFLGLLRKGSPIVTGSAWAKLLCVYVIFTLVSLWTGAFYLGFPPPLPGDQRFKDWLAYMTMPAIFFAAAAAVESVREMKIIVLLMCLATLQLDRSFYNSVRGRDFSSYSEDLRQTMSAGGSMGYAGVNGLAAFEAQAATFLLAMAAFEKRVAVKLAYSGLAFYSALCLMYSLSRGGYVAFVAGWLFIGLMKQRTLLVAMGLFILTWTAVVPNAVVERVEMTKSRDGQLDHSAELRVAIWEDAVGIIRDNAWFGTGFNTYPYMGRVGSYQDTHNYYLEVLVETGAAGMLLFLCLLFGSAWKGWRLSRRAADPLIRGLGLGLSGWVVASAAANAFGDRWTYLQIQGFFWVIAGLVTRGLAMEDSREQFEDEASGTDEDAMDVEGVSGAVPA
jgi:O-antigen ligase